jgi:hypothetical protein
MKKYILTSILTLLFVTQAQALFELRAGYGVNTPADKDYGVSTLSTMTGFNLDAIAELPMIPFGIGLRYESMGLDLQTAGTDFTTDMKRTSLIVNYRFIDFFTYLGVIGTIGFTNDVDVKYPGNTVKYDSNLTYSAGLEGGVSLGLVMIGGELGYLSANFKSSALSDLDLSGVYAKAIVGVGF